VKNRDGISNLHPINILKAFFENQSESFPNFWRPQSCDGSLANRMSVVFFSAKNIPFYSPWKFGKGSL
jgi:hypothetical protein